jgi:hypothetical protein
MKLIGLVLRGARYSDEILEVGDLAIHGEEAFPEETLAQRIAVSSMAGDPAPSASIPSNEPDRGPPPGAES